MESPGPRPEITAESPTVRRDGLVPETGPPPATSDQLKSEQYEDSLVRDVVKYFALGYADEVRKPLLKLLTELPLPDGVMIVSHSFGTIISYDVLIRSLDDIAKQRASAGYPPLTIDTWVTMGCPLGWVLDVQEQLPYWAQKALVKTESLKTQVDTAFKRVTRWTASMLKKLDPTGLVRSDDRIFQLGIKQFPPRNLNRWCNIYDPRDPVSYPPFIARAFGGSITVGDAFLCQGKQRAFDIHILNELRSEGFRLTDPEAHNDTGYGKSAQLAQLARDFWTRDQQATTPSRQPTPTARRTDRGGLGARRTPS
jgi:hypothetical protein